MKSLPLKNLNKASRRKIPSTEGSLFRRRALIIYNPVAGYSPGRRLSRVCQSLSWLGVEQTVRETAYRGDAEAFAATASSRDFDVVAAAGGDGTINEVVNGLAGSPLPLSIIPLGTANVLAAEIELPRKASAIARTIAAGETRRVHLGVANGRRFLMMAGLGFDAHVVSHVNQNIKQAVGKLAYVLQTGVSAFTFPSPAYRVVIDGVGHEAASVVIANGRRYGGPYSCAPDARIEAPEFHVCLFKSSGPLSIARYSTALMMSRLHQLSDIEIVRGGHVVVEGPEGEPVQCDGDIATTLPLTASIGADTLNLVVPVT